MNDNQQLLNLAFVGFEELYFYYSFQIIPSLKTSKNVLTSVDVKLISIVHLYREGQEIKGCSGLQIYSNQQMSSVELSSCCSYLVFRQQFAVKRVKCSAITHFENNLNSSPGLLGQRFNNLQFSCTFDLIGSIWQISSKFGQQQLVMMNYACDFSQSETEKYFE